MAPKLSDAQVREFHDTGMLIAPDVFSEADLKPVIDDISALIDERAREAKAAGHLTELHEDKPFETRMAFLKEQYPAIAGSFDIMQTRRRPMFEFLFNDSLLDALECLIGPELTCSPIQHLRAKMPAKKGEQNAGYLGDVPWHQDVAVTWEEADPVEIVTCWIPLVDATRENGCMEVVPGVTERGYLEHNKVGGTSIREDLFPTDKPVICAECPKGGVVFMNKYTPHRGLSNFSDVIRWTLDLRYQPTGTPTGRPFQPEFIVRSKADPSSVQDSYEAWCARWEHDLRVYQGYAGHRTVPVGRRTPAERAAAEAAEASGS